MSRTNNDIAEAYVAGAQPKKRKGALYFSGDTIYSYGNHFPIAKRVGENEYLFNTRHYSVTTSNHQNIVKSALGSVNAKIYYCPNCSLNELADYYQNIILSLLSSAQTARTKLNYYIVSIYCYVALWRQCKERFSLESQELDAISAWVRLLPKPTTSKEARNMREAILNLQKVTLRVGVSK